MSRRAVRLVDVEPRALEASANRASRLKELLSGLVDLAADELASRTSTRRITSPLLTPDQAAELLRIPKSTLLELAARGAVPSLRFGKHVRFDPTELAEAGRKRG
jgi:excisionase family DNA binding protein